MVRFFIGSVESVNESIHTIEFSISDFTGSYIKMTAIPLSPIVILPKAGDEVLILQPNSDIEVFYYTQMPKTSSSQAQIEIRFDDSHYIILNKDHVLINGHLEIT